MSTQTYLGTLTVISCAACGAHFGMERHFEQERRGDHKTFYCPSGHSNYFPAKSQADTLRDLLARETHRAEQAAADAQRQRERRESAERSARAFRGVATRIKKRVKHGVCPCCNRTFANVAAHMQTQHPKYAEDRPEARPPQ